jgi:hypothetical protein
VLFPPPDLGAGWQDKGSQAVEHLTAVGHVRVRRRVWWKPSVGTQAPGDEWLNGGGPRISVGARELCSHIGQFPQGFRKSAEALQRLAGLTVSPERLRQIVEGEGRRMAAARAAGQVPPGWQADECCVTPEGPSRVYVGVDGVMVPMVTVCEKAKRRATRARRRRGRRAARRRWGRGYRECYKEFKLTVFYDQAKQRRQVTATGGGPDAVGRELRRTGRRLGVERTDEVLAIVDGAPWIRAQLQRWRNCDRIGLDFYHFTEHVAAAANACFGEGTAPAAAWREQVLHAALHTGPDEVLDEIARQRQQTRAPAKREALRRLQAYVGERVAMMDYPACRAHGWDLGSGPTEAQCKTLTARLKGSGMRWDPPNAEAMLALSGLAASDEWSAYWHGQGAQWN